MTQRPQPPTIPGWEILGHVGSGGMGAVWKARRADGVVAALKVVKPVDRLTAGEVASHFRREALACFNVDHPNIVRALDAGTTVEGLAYLALEYVEGRTLHELMKSGALAGAHVLEIGAGLAKALGEVHRRGLVHCDVKPRNVILPAARGVKLLDFGLVVESQDRRGEQGMGTAGYMAPEVEAGAKPDARSDLYSLGATLAAAATGEVPGHDVSFADRTLPSSAGSRPIAPGLRQVIERLLRSDPAARYPTAAEVLLDLEAVAAGERPLGAILGSGGARVARRGPRIVVAVVCAVAFGGIVWRVASRSDVAAPPALQSPAAVTVAPEARDPAIAAARIFVEQFPDDFARGRELIAQAESASLDPAARAEVEALQRALAARFEAAAEREFAARLRMVDDAAAQCDVPEARRVAAGWPEPLRASPRAAELTRAAEAAASRLRAENEALAADARRIVEDAARGATSAGIDAAADAWTARLETALARPPFDGDAREGLTAWRERVEDARRTVSAARVASDALAAWHAAFAAHVASPSQERLRAALAAAETDTLPESTRSAAASVAAAWLRGEAWVASRIGALQGKPWCGPWGPELRCDAMAVAPSADLVFLSPLWSVSGGRPAAVVAVAKGADEGAAWLLARGLADEAIAASGPGGAVTRLLAGVPLGAPPREVGASWPRGVDLAMALREVGGRGAVASPDDTVLAAWAAAVGSQAQKAVPSPRHPEKAAGRDAFLAGDLAEAARALTVATIADPCDAEVAALRGRVFLAGARTVPTAPALLAAFSEGRRAWDLDPRLPAGPLLVAEAGIEVVERAGRSVADAVRPVTAAACDAVDAVGRADARMLQFAGEHHLTAGRAQQAAERLRRAAAAAPDSWQAALLLARAEHACGRDAPAREALRRARDLLHGDLPDDADSLVRDLGH